MSTPVKDLMEFHALFNERGETDERAIAVVGAAFLDSLLERMLVNYLVDDQKECQRLLGPEQAMGTFSSRVTATYCLGLICKTVRDDLRIVGKIRNLFAHEIQASFGNEPIRGWCSSLRWYEFSMMMRAPAEATARDVFQVAVNQLICYLSGRADMGLINRCRVREDDKDGPTILR